MCQSSDRVGDGAYRVGKGEEQCGSCNDRSCSDQNFIAGQLFDMIKYMKKT